MLDTSEEQRKTFKEQPLWSSDEHQILKIIQLGLSFQGSRQKELEVVLRVVKCAVMFTVSCQKVAVLNVLYKEGSVILIVILLVIVQG